MRKVTIAATQMSAVWDREEMIRKAENLVRTAAEKGAQVVLLQELFETPYFCQRQDIKYLDLAVPLEESRAVKHFQTVAEELRIVIPVSFFERYGNTQFNTVAMIDGTGNSLVSTGKHIYRTACHMQKNFILHREIPDIKYGIHFTAGSEWGSAGISGSPKRPGPWP